MVAQRAVYLSLLQCFHDLNTGLPAQTYRLNLVLVDLFKFSNLAYPCARCQPTNTSVSVRLSQTCGFAASPGLNCPVPLVMKQHSV